MFFADEASIIINELINMPASSSSSVLKNPFSESITTTDFVMEIFSDYNDQGKNIIKATPKDELFKWGIFARAPSENWSSEFSTLLGDAAHPLEPFMGQGARMAIEDGVVLSRIIADSGTQNEIIDRYQKARIERAHFVTEHSKKAGMRCTGRTPDDYSKEDHKNEEELGLFYYDPSTVEI